MKLNNSSFKFAELELSQHLHRVQKDFKHGTYVIDDLGRIIPGCVMIHDVQEMQPLGISYINNWGSTRLGTSLKEINNLGKAYYKQYFIEEESQAIIKGLGSYLDEADFDKQYNFFQRVKLYQEKDYKWFYSISKLIQIKEESGLVNKILMLSSPIEGMDLMIYRVKKILDEDVFIQNNYRRFSMLTKREKMIITLITNDKSSREIANELFISIHTVNTHRKNIIRKTDCASFAALVKFAYAFELV